MIVQQQQQNHYSTEVHTIIHFHRVQKINLDFNIEESPFLGLCVAGTLRFVGRTFQI